MLCMCTLGCTSAIQHNSCLDHSPGRPYVMHTYTNICMHTVCQGHVHTCTHGALTHTHTRTHTHTHTRTHTHTHTHVSLRPIDLFIANIMSIFLCPLAITYKAKSSGIAADKDSSCVCHIFINN